jgi:hypothetical protein
VDEHHLDETEQLDRVITRLQIGERPTPETDLDPTTREVGRLVIALRQRPRIEWPDEDFPSLAVARLARDLRPKSASVSPTSERGAHGVTDDDYGVDTSQLIRLPVTAGKRKSWTRHGAEIAAAIVVLALFAGMLAALLDVNGSRDRPSVGGQVPTLAAPQPTTPAVNSLVLSSPMPITNATPINGAPLMTPPPLSNHPLTLEEAEDRVRAFLGEPDAELSGGLSVPDTNPTLATYEITREIGLHNYQDEFSVDPTTGELREADLPSQTSLMQPTKPVSESEAHAIAETFARQHFVGFGSLTLHDEQSLDVAAGGDTVHAITWQKQATDSGAWLPQWVRVGVDLKTGRVSSYFSVRYDYHGPNVPTISQDQAIAAALTEAKKDPEIAGATAGKVELAVGAFDGTYRLAWTIQLDGIPQGADIRQFYVDALSGEVLNPVGSPHG